MKVCTLSDFGDISKFKILNVKEPNMVGPTEVIIRYNSIAINFDDVMYRRGKYPIQKSFLQKDLVLGFEGVGVIEKKGEKVQGFKVGDTVAHAIAPFGTYSHYRVIDYRYLIHVPSDINHEIVSGVLRKALIVENMLFKIHKPKVGEWILVHSAAGGVGHILTKWARSAGLNVIGTVSSDTKISTALAMGCNVVIDRSKEKISQKVLECTDNVGVSAVYDGIGQPVFEESMISLKPLGMYISYGYAGGLMDKINVLDLRSRSASFVTPVIDICESNRYEYIFSTSAIFEVIRKGIIMPQLSRYAFDAIPQAHLDLESSKTTGSLVVNSF